MISRWAKIRICTIFEACHRGSSQVCHNKFTSRPQECLQGENFENEHYSAHRIVNLFSRRLMVTSIWDTQFTAACLPEAFPWPDNLCRLPTSPLTLLVASAINKDFARYPKFHYRLAGKDCRVQKGFLWLLVIFTATMSVASQNPHARSYSNPKSSRLTWNERIDCVKPPNLMNFANPWTPWSRGNCRTGSGPPVD